MAVLKSFQIYEYLNKLNKTIFGNSGFYSGFRFITTLLKDAEKSS